MQQDLTEPCKSTVIKKNLNGGWADGWMNEWEGTEGSGEGYLPSNLLLAFDSSYVPHLCGPPVSPAP